MALQKSLEETKNLQITNPSILLKIKPYKAFWKKRRRFLHYMYKNNNLGGIPKDHINFSLKKSHMVFPKRM
jgi:hypothetical protein